MRCAGFSLTSIQHRFIQSRSIMRQRKEFSSFSKFSVIMLNSLVSRVENRQIGTVTNQQDKYWDQGRFLAQIDGSELKTFLLRMSNSRPQPLPKAPCFTKFYDSLSCVTNNTLLGCRPCFSRLRLQFFIIRAKQTIDFRPSERVPNKP